MDNSNNIEHCIKKILKATSYDEARLIFDDTFFMLKDKKEQIALIETLSCKIEKEENVPDIARLYDFCGELKLLSKFLKTCPFQETDTVKIQRISVEKRLGNHNIAAEISNTLSDPNNFIALNQRASALNKIGHYNEAREIVERIMLIEINRYNIKTYASIINNLMKQDDYAYNLAIPSLAKDICKAFQVDSFDFKRLLKQVIKYETNCGNKRKAQITNDILKNYLNYLGQKSK